MSSWNVLRNVAELELRVAAGDKTADPCNVAHAP